MTVSLWRWAHLALALVSSVFLLILSVTGVILAVGAVSEKTQSYKVDNFNTLYLSQALPVLGEVYPEISTLTVDHNGFVSIEATDSEGQPVHAYIDPNTGSILGEVKPQSDFIQWNITLHRSLFLKETGRIIVGFVSFLLLLITLTGILLIIKRQQGVRHFFSRINKDFFSVYFHVVSGRIFLIPVLLIALTGTYLFMVRLGLTKGNEENIPHEVAEDAHPKALADFPVFQETLLHKIEKIEFPFIPDDPEEYFILKLRDREIMINQVNGAVIEETLYPYSLVWEKLSLDLHTGRTSGVLAIVLGFASLNILFFMYTGFAISLRRKPSRIRNPYTASTAEYILLAGSENGSTLGFAHKIHEQLLALGYTSFLAEMNRFTHYPEARHLIIFTSTYGLGTAPANATAFERLITEYSPSKPLHYSVVGFGSRAYPDFCAYAQLIDQKLSQVAHRYVDLHTVNDRSAEEFTEWVRAWSSKSGCGMGTTPALYATKITGLKEFKVVEKTRVTEDNATFRVTLKPLTGQTFRSGDLLAVYPANDGRERLYSIGKTNGNIQLMVKLHVGGLGSEFLYGLEEGNRISARLVTNKNFHFPTKAPAVVMIANGTGIAPFLGMISENKKKRPLYLYAGFRHKNVLSTQYRDSAEAQMTSGYLRDAHFAFSREENPQYVMDLIRRDATFFSEHLSLGGVIMICGSLAMQRDVEEALRNICAKQGINSVPEQILTDCY